jgi:CheY-like chemotaxis protein/DNA-directed RNA polymerase specialized sigma24 family protein
MTLSGAIAHHLPMLRRFARALTGSQEGGDAYVLATLEAMAETGQRIDPDDVRRGLFKALLAIWNSVPLNARTNTDPSPEGIARAADRSLERMTPRSRVAFLLNSLEGFPIDDIAVIMDISFEEAAALQETAGREIATMISTSVLIIEDEPIIAMDLEALVTDLGHSVTEVARTHREALTAIAQNEPGLVLADIHLADGSSGLDAVNEILTEYNLPVIFITAYPERLLTGQRPEPTFLITKPFRPEVVKAIISQALFFDRRAGLGRELAEAG